VPRQFLAFVEASEVPEHLCLGELKWRLLELGFLLRLATCCTRIAGHYAKCASAGLKSVVDCHPVAIKRAIVVGFGGEFLQFPEGGQEGGPPTSSDVLSPHVCTKCQEL
jgi:hypothetical protein